MTNEAIRLWKMLVLRRSTPPMVTKVNIVAERVTDGDSPVMLA